MSKDIKIKEIAKDICLVKQSCNDVCNPEDCCQALKYAERAYEEKYRKQEWISVKDKLPEKNVRVLVYLETDRSYTKIDTDRLDNRGFVRWYKDVTHWMPLPQPPETKGETE